ncbi:hypothetical protein [Dyella sp. ASV21]|uniref:hypothetical protein n=1 Tax=Dyella sp. ASV21 TaxID=2795114 RepID=UPI0018ED224E|nr:hypothetical protein [Dyella sp. ASV21]
MSQTTTIPVVADEANQLFTALAGDLKVNLDLPDLVLPTDFQMPPEADNPAYTVLEPITVEQLTTKDVAGTGVFDALMATINTHLVAQFEKGRITGGDYAKSYTGAITAAMQFGVQFLLGKDQAYLQNLQTQANIQLAQAQKVRALADIQVARAQVQQMAFTSIEMRFKAYTARNEYAGSKMRLVTDYNGILTSEAQAKLITEQVDSARAETKDTLQDGKPIMGVVGMKKAIMEAEQQTALEQLDVARAQTKDTLLDGSPISGITAVDKAFKEAQQIQMEHQGQLTLEQVETQRAQTRDTLTTGQAIGGLLGVEKQTKVAALSLVTEQVETQRAQTWDNHTNGQTITGILAAEKALKNNQAKLVLEQYETQRGQTRGTLSTGEQVGGVLGAQTKLYNQQVISYQRDAESKYAKLLLDTWTARKTIDEGVAVPGNIDTPAINSMIQTYRNNLQL